jgi:lipoprotein-anchoring transpeptidase ErfK/SrfK
LGALAAAAVVQAVPASAQLLFDWGGGSTVDASGREVVRFNPQYSKGQVIVSFGDRRLYYITQPGQAISYPIAIPREQSRWAGVTSVTQKRENPSWTPTPTMVAENPRLPRWVPGGHPMNPLGVRALYLGSSMYRIHGTDAPWTIGTAVSKGCIRMYNQDVLDLYPRVSVGTKVTVTWDRFTTTASSAPTAKAATPPSSQSGSSFFDLFGDEEEPVQKAPPRRTRSKAKSASLVE